MTVSVAHLPTLALLIGYILFWIEMWSHPGPQTSWAAWILLIAAAMTVLTPTIKKIPNRPKRTPGIFKWMCMGIGALMIGLTLVASLLPPHLAQEMDAMNYHYTIPRQHLILGSFKHLSWSTADLWPLPVQFGLSPYWFATTLPNKLPQFFFLAGFIAVAVRLTKRISSHRSAPWVITAVILGSHGLGIQFGTAMLDIPIAYLGLAALDSWLSGDEILGGVELAFFFCSKSFMPIQTGFLIIALASLYAIRQRWGVTVTLGLGKSESSHFAWPKSWPLLRNFVLAALLIGGPFAAKSMVYAGTPLYPFFPLAFDGRLGKDPIVRDALQNSAEALSRTRNNYGEGRNLRSLVTHIWSVAVPSKGVNNAFDYPLGLPWLLVIGPFLLMQVQAARRKRISFLGVVGILLWGFWWMGSQQTRWLFLPLVVFALSLTNVDEMMGDPLLQGGLGIALLLCLLSLTRSYRADLKHWPQPILRVQDQVLLDRSRLLPVGESLLLATKEAAFSERVVVVQNADPCWILPISKYDSL